MPGRGPPSSAHSSATASALRVVMPAAARGRRGAPVREGKQAARRDSNAVCESDALAGDYWAKAKARQARADSLPWAFRFQMGHEMLRVAIAAHAPMSKGGLRYHRP